MRPLPQVIQAILNVTPETFENRAEMSHELEKIADSSCYAAPEMQSFWWGRAMETLEIYLGTPVEGWRKTIAQIVGNQLDYNDYLEGKCPSTTSS